MAAHLLPAKKRRVVGGGAISSGKKKRDVASLFDYIAELSSNILFELFGETVIVSSFFESLNDAQQTLVCRLLFMKQPVSERVAKLWMNIGSEGLLKKLLLNLKARHILCHSALVDKQGSMFSQYFLQPAFQSSLYNHATGVANTLPYSLIKYDPGKLYDLISWSALQHYSLSKWNCLLRWMMQDQSLDENICEVLAPNIVFKPFTKPCEDTIDILRIKNLIVEDSNVGGLSAAKGGMSQEAFSWLLKDLRNQICSLIVEFLILIDGGILTEMASSRASKKVSSIVPSFQASAEKKSAVESEIKELLLMIFTLSRSCVGQAYTKASLTNIQKRLLNVLSDMGLVWINPENVRNPEIEYFLTAPLCLVIVTVKHDQFLSALSSDFSAQKKDDKSRSSVSGLLSTDETGSAKRLLEYHIHPNLKHNVPGSTGNNNENPGFTAQTTTTLSHRPIKNFDPGRAESGIVVQSNFKVYCYTSSPLQMNILSNLCLIESRTPNLIVGLITREKILAIYKSGITANQILRFISTHAHPIVRDDIQRENGSVVPVNVVMQLKMWEEERNRVKFHDAVIFKSWEESLVPNLYQQDDTTDSIEFEKWQASEKYLVVPEDAQEEIINRIQEIKKAALTQQ